MLGNFESCQISFDVFALTSQITDRLLRSTDIKDEVLFCQDFCSNLYQKCVCVLGPFFSKMGTMICVFMWTTCEIALRDIRNCPSAYNEVFLFAELQRVLHIKPKKKCIMTMVGTRNLWKNTVVLCLNS